MFDKDVPYRRTEIQRLVGGEVRTYLPQRNGRILAGCFSLEMNPRAPERIFAGDSPKVAAKAQLLGSQPENAFPVFLCRRNDNRKYFFKGYYRCTGITDNRELVLEAEALSARHGELAYVLYLEEARKE